MFDVGHIEHTLHHHDGLLPAQFTQSRGAIKFNQRKAVCSLKCPRCMFQTVAIGIRLHHGPCSGVWNGFSGSGEISLHRSNMRNGDEWSGHQRENSEKRDQMKWNKAHFTGRVSRRDERLAAGRVETGFRGIKQAAVALCTSLPITVSPE